MTKDPETRKRFIDLRAEGWTLTKITEELSISYKTAISWNKEDTELIDMGRALHAEELQEKYFMAKLKRIELYGERLLAIKEELDKRDLSEIPTPKLFEMMVKCEAILNKEQMDLRFMTTEDMKKAKASREQEDFLSGLGLP